MKNVVAILLLLSISSCVDRNKKTTLEIIDNNRHYYPILQGQELDIVVNVVNVGENAFALTDLHTSCGCITVEKSSIKTLLPEKEGTVVLKYNSTKNVGFVEHYITLYGNFENDDKMEIKFDVNVVPNALYTKDYEELFLEERDKERSRFKDLVDGRENSKGYYMDDN